MTEVKEASGAPQWRPVEKNRAYQMVVAQIEEQILHGSLVVGDRLPAERDLAAMLGVSRAAVREAIRTLEAQGVVRSSVGVGPDGGTVVTSLPAEALSRMLRLHVALTNFPMQDVIEARVMLERYSARLAARGRTSADLQRLRSLSAAMHTPDISPDDFNELDTAFHVAVADASGNRLVADMTTAIRESMRLPILASFRSLEDWSSHADRLCTEHVAVLTAIEAGDEHEAATSVEEHIRFNYTTMKWDRPSRD